jgi:serine/threonine protein kinase/Tfp pilus assembly protein PilF
VIHGTASELADALRERYLIERELGRGGMATVYLAKDLKHHREVAVKVLRAELAAALGPERFLREIEISARLHHPHILPLYDSGEAEGFLFYVMPFVKGQSLRDRLTREKQLPLDDALQIALEVADALSFAHDGGVVHRDIKPENILLESGHAVVADFGIAKAISEAGGEKLTETGIVVGTPAYMSPEQAFGEENLDGRSDIYALGCVLYEMLGGDPPFTGSSAQAILARKMVDQIPSLRTVRETVPFTVERAVRKALARVPADRFAIATQFAEALRETDAPESSTGNGTSPTLLTSIAVLPFVFLSDEDNTKALSLGFADALITIFGNLEDVVVAPTSAILSYAAGTKPAQVCGELGVRHTLQGTIQRLGSHWRVSIQLFDAATHKTTLSEKHDFQLDDVFEVQDEIGRRVVESLRRRFPLTVSRSRDRYSSDPAAYNEFMAGLRESSPDREETLRNAAHHLIRAVERDPEFALAHATLAQVSMDMHFHFDPRPTWLKQAEDHCGRALTLDPALPEAHLARAWILWSPARNFQHAEALASLQEVLAARPNHERAHNRIAGICLHIGRLQEARIAHEHARLMNPKTRTGNLEWFYILSGDYARAEEAVEAWFQERPPGLYVLGTRILPPLLSGDLDLAEQRTAMALKQYPDEPWLLTSQGMLYARRNQSDLALECVRRALGSPSSFGHTHHTYHHVACIHAVLGETDTAMAWLERSVNTGFACWPFFRLDPYLENLREDSAFKRLVAELEQTYSALRIQRL